MKDLESFKQTFSALAFVSTVVTILIFALYVVYEYVMGIIGSHNLFLNFIFCTVYISLFAAIGYLFSMIAGEIRKDIEDDKNKFKNKFKI